MLCCMRSEESRPTGWDALAARASPMLLEELPVLASIRAGRQAAEDAGHEACSSAYQVEVLSPGSKALQGSDSFVQILTGVEG